MSLRPTRVPIPVVGKAGAEAPRRQLRVRIEFVDRGEHELNGVRGLWRLFSVAS
jgi:hypothetical protein